MITTDKTQLYECDCGELTNDQFCPNCGNRPLMIFTIHDPTGYCVGYVRARDFYDANIEVNKHFKSTENFQLHFRFATPEDGAIPE